MAYTIHYDDAFHTASSDWYLEQDMLSVVYPSDISYVDDEDDDEEYHGATSVTLAYDNLGDGMSATEGARTELSESFAVWPDGSSSGSGSDSDSEYSGSRRERVSDITTISVSTGGDFFIDNLLTQHSELSFDVSFPSTVSEHDIGSLMGLGVFQPMVNVMMVPALDLTGAIDVQSDDEDLGCPHAISGVSCHCLTARNLNAVQDILKELRRIEDRELKSHETANWQRPRTEPDRRSDQAWEKLTVDLHF
ncbi:hypothetical protein B0T20DRAFT_33287 [Sordaria brevicollis]|uniref:Uncharacterized protein n=1 Tax=Sordaria brevicollis TaxID=83679 RepID=A0AAE0P8Q0_SORBR|nr:hypothetical protein B0T20DRAFT_33287 [Sordaria brevicollis]